MAENPGKTEPAVPHEPAANARPRSSKLPRFFIIATLFTLALWMSWNVRLQWSAGQEDAAPPKHPTKEPRSEETLAEVLTRADNALRQLRHADALLHLGELRHPGMLDTPLVSYRLALAQEANGLVEIAIASYRRALGKAGGPLTFACHLGLSRCLLRQNETGEARRLLYPFLFDETRQVGVSDDLVAEANYLIALALARENAGPDDPFGPDAAVSSARTALDTVAYLDEILADTPRKAAAVPADRLEIADLTDQETIVLQSVHQMDQPAVALFDRLATEAGWKAQWTPEARQALADRTLTLHLHNWELNDLLEWSADHFGLACLIEEPIVRIVTRAQAEGKRATECRRGTTQRALESAIHTDTNHLHTSAALLELGNLHAAESRWHDAAHWYNRLVRDARSSPHVTSAYYNLARARRQSPEPALARRAFYRVIDHAPGHELALRASIQIAQLYLIEDEVPQAIAQLQRAEAMAGRAPHQALATLTLAAAHLHADDPQAARKTLGRARQVLEQDPYRPTAAFLDCYAQYRYGKRTKDAKIGVTDLIETLLRNKDETVLGAHGRWLLAQAYFDLGFWDQAETQARRALVDASAPFQPCVEYTLGLTLMQKNQRGEAEQIFMRWSQRENTYRARARYQLARLNLEERRFRECIEVCQTLWKERGFPDDGALLRVWGAALEASGDLAKAAQCYSGKTPD